jgi:hypothetical protein
MDGGPVTPTAPPTAAPSEDPTTAPPTGGAALDPLVRQRVHRLWRPVALVVGLLLVVAFAAWLQGRGSVGYLDPDAADQTGGMALRVLLEERGVVVHRAEQTAAAAAAPAGSTLLVVSSGAMTSGQLATLRGSAADLVVLDPDDRVIQTLAPSLTAGSLRTLQARDPACDLSAAVRAGRALVGGLGFVARPAATGVTLCYTDAGSAFVARVDGGARTTVLVGSGRGFTNAHLAEEGDAALALNLLGANGNLTWYVASSELPPGGGDQSAGDLLPAWVGVAVLQLVVVVLLAAWWRGRRLGPAVEEALPADVPAAEATEGRARLYRRRRARDRAAQHLRAASVARLRPGLGLPPGTVDPQALVAAVSARSGRPSSDVAAVLVGPVPADDAALVRLAHELDTLERQVRQR